MPERERRGTDAQRPLDGRVALVTGASSGIGMATAQLLASAGARVHGAARRFESSTPTDAPGGVSGDWAAHGVDVTDAGAVKQLVREIGERDGLDILICAAGTNLPERQLEQLTPESWDSILAVNLNGAFYCLGAALPYLRRTRGDVVFVGSVSGSWPDAAGAAYQASKAGMLALARATALEEHDKGIRCTAILPGMVNTPILERRANPPSAEMREQILKPGDVAAACLFVVTLPPRAYVPELTLLPTALQALGAT
ncbi:MAG: SDR family oxidoreductase [Chloroflexota bacterium]|nr:SDR family oxidoreductase [Chloroflexota bacterium]